MDISKKRTYLRVGCENDVTGILREGTLHHEHSLLSKYRLEKCLGFGNYFLSFIIFKLMR